MAPAGTEKSIYKTSKNSYLNAIPVTDQNNKTTY